jgi:hypothetical protein
MDIVSRRVAVNKISLDAFRDVLNKSIHQIGNDAIGMFKIFNSEYLIPNQIEVLESFMLMGSPMLLIEEKGKKKMVALDAEYDDTPSEDLDRSMQKTYLEHVKLFSMSRQAEPYVARFTFTRGHDKKTFGEQSYSWIRFLGISKIN